MRYLVFLIVFFIFSVTAANNVTECSLQSVGVSSYQDLYKDLKNPPKSDEDLGRYIGYGWRPFGGVVYKFFSTLLGSGCHSLYKDAEILCSSFKYVKSARDVISLGNQLKVLLDTLPYDSKGYNLVNKLFENIQNYTGNNRSAAFLLEKFSNDVLKIENYYKYRNIFVDDNQRVVYIPYTWLVPLNIVFNRSLQNRSSYYTDIGYVWLIMWVVVFLSLLYSIVSRNKFLFALTISAIFGYIVWWLVGSAILWYGIGLVIWTILVNVMFFYYLLKDLGNFRVLGYLVIAIYIGFFGYQLFLNFVRISSQGGGGPFVWYKESNGYITEYDDTLNAYPKLVFPYKRLYIFDLQFPHYKKFLQVANFTGRDYNIFLAGTYARYFVKNQKGIVYDQMLGSLWKWMSDWDACKTYLRVAKDKNIKYIAIDPNIGTVVMGEGNKTLFDRFFGDINLDTWNVEKYGVLTFLGKMYESGFLDYYYSNNIAAKYGFSLSDEELINYLKKFNSNLSNLTKEDMAILRGGLVALRYPWIWRVLYKKFIGDNKEYLKNDMYLYNFWLNFIANIFVDRMKNGEVVSDIADMFGKQIDKDKVKLLYLAAISGKYDKVRQGIKYLSQDERYVLASALGLVDLYQKNKRKFMNSVGEIVANSVGSSSQIFVIKFK